jgi:hypothetical protein
MGKMNLTKINVFLNFWPHMEKVIDTKDVTKLRIIFCDRQYTVSLKLNCLKVATLLTDV